MTTTTGAVSGVNLTDPSLTGAAIIGAAVPRIDGSLKTTGTAQYSADFHFANLAHAVPVQSTIASGRIRKLDTSTAEKMPGVVLVLHHGNIGPLFRMAPGGHGGQVPAGGGQGRGRDPGRQGLLVYGGGVRPSGGAPAAAG